jgi:hypothetical protein
MKLVFTPPNDDDIENVNIQSLEQLLMKAPADYWESGSGDAALRVYEGGRVHAEVILVLRDRLGALVQYTAAIDRVQYVLVASEDREASVTIEHGGNPWTLPKAFFVPRQLAVIAVREFCKTGGRSSELVWEEF